MVVQHQRQSLLEGPQDQQQHQQGRALGGCRGEELTGLAGSMRRMSGIEEESLQKSRTARSEKGREGKESAEMRQQPGHRAAESLRRRSDVGKEKILHCRWLGKERHQDAACALNLY